MTYRIFCIFIFRDVKVDPNVNKNKQIRKSVLMKYETTWTSRPSDILLSSDSFTLITTIFLNAFI